MRRNVVAPILCAALVIGLGVLTASASMPQDDPGRQLVSVHVKDASIQEVVQIITTASGANIMLGDVSGRITLHRDNVSVEKVLDQMCQAKGFYWWRDDDGTYIVSDKPRPAPSAQAVALPGLPLADEKDSKQSRMYHLQFLPPQYVAYLFGTADDPGPMPFTAEGAFGDVGSVLSPFGRQPKAGGLGEFAGAGGGGGGRGGGGGGGGGRAGGGGGGGAGGGGRAGGGGGAAGGGGGFYGAGALSMFLPEDVDAMIAFPPLNTLLIHGTEESINDLIEILKMVDRKPQQIIVELQSLQVSTTWQKQLGVDWYYIAGNTTITPQGMGTPASIIVSYSPPGVPNFRATLTYLLETGRGRIVDAIRVSTMNLLPAVNSVNISYPWVTVGAVSGDPFRGSNVQTLTVSTYNIATTLYITPRINGDGTITMYIPFQKSNITGTVQVPSQFGNISYPIVTTQNLTTTVNVRDGETFVIGGFVNKDLLETERRLPLLGTLPIIGDLLFTRQVRTVNESETLLFITPRIVKEEAAPATLGPI